MARVLVVEDDADVRGVVCEALRALGHHPEPAVDGREALRVFGLRHCDAVVTDIAMPHMDGLELTERLHLVSPALPILILTGRGSLAAMARAVNGGVVGYLHKPYRAGDLEAALRRALPPPRGSASLSISRRRWRLWAAAVVVAAAWLTWRLVAGPEQARPTAARLAATAAQP
jgi:DNA-binding response OmpR family regulator